MNNLEGDSFGHGNESPNMDVGSWLLSKLIPARKDQDDDLIVALPGLSLWKKWIHSERDADLSCCLSVISDKKFDQPSETILGANAVVFLFSVSISWDLQKMRLYNLVMSLPSGCHLPLLILSGSYKEDVPDFSAVILDRLGVSDIDKSRISTVSLLFLIEKQGVEPLDGFFSDERLREGLQWVASESPIQPLINRVKTRELALTHLNSLLDVLEKMDVYKVGPHQCISAFNEALDQSKWEITEAANANSAGWPCPEIALLQEFGDEHRACKLLSSVGWSSGETIKPLVCALDDIKLPAFLDNISWLGTGSNTVEEIGNKRTQLENCLTRYLTQSSKMMGLAQATNEASIIVQRNTGLELHNSSFYIIPKWVGIFRRIFNWQLGSLSNGDFSSAYVLQRERDASQTSRLDRLKIEANISSPYHLNHPSLDEMVEVSCAPLWSGSTWPMPGNCRYHFPMSLDDNEVQEAANTSEFIERDSGSSKVGEQDVMHNTTYSSNVLPNTKELQVAATVKKETNRLNDLLESCNILQDMIGRKLSVYF